MDGQEDDKNAPVDDALVLIEAEHARFVVAWLRLETTAHNAAGRAQLSLVRRQD